MDYLSSWLNLSTNMAWLLGVAIIAVLAYLNICGLNVIALNSIVMTVIILVPFVAITMSGFANWHGLAGRRARRRARRPDRSSLCDP